MGLSQRLVMKQGQSLVMTPQLQQAIKLLQMSNVEIQEFVEAELERNPLLERPNGVVESKPPEPGADMPDAPFGAETHGAEGDGSDSAADGVPVKTETAGPMPDMATASTRSMGQVSLDGELRRLHTPLDYRIHPGGLRVLSPPLSPQ